MQTHVMLDSLEHRRGTSSPRLPWPWRLWSPFQPRLSLVATLGFLAAWTCLSVTFNMRYPGSEDRLWYLIPSLDVTVILVLFAACGLAGKQLPAGICWALAALSLVVRLLRIGDGIETRYYSANFNVYIDLPLLPEFIRLAYATTSHVRFAVTMTGIIAGIVLLLILNFHCWWYSSRILCNRISSSSFLVVAALLASVSAFGRWRPPFFGVFAESAVPRLAKEGDFILHGAQYRKEILDEVTRVDTELKRNQNNLARLNRNNVYLFLIESYGETVLDQPELRSRIMRTYSHFETQAAKQGFQMASGLLDSPTYGGGSWLAHATLATSINTNDQFRYRIVCSARPVTLARFFNRAEYRTILVQPATTRPSVACDASEFNRKYYAPDFDYRGPRFSWALMPDQYVLHFIHANEVVAAKGPLFIQYALVSSHAPWNIQPPLIADSAAIGDGRIYNELKPVAFPSSWSDMSNATGAYLRSLEYDFDVLLKHISEEIRDSSLIIILGDHQPNGEITRHNRARGVPIHIVSRNRDFLEPFIAHGYIHGMTPSLAQRRLPMDRFMASFLEDFSTKGQASNLVGQHGSRK